MPIVSEKRNEERLFWHTCNQQTPPIKKICLDARMVPDEKRCFAECESDTNEMKTGANGANDNVTFD